MTPCPINRSHRSFTADVGVFSVSSTIALIFAGEPGTQLHLGSVTLSFAQYFAKCGKSFPPQLSGICFFAGLPLSDGCWVDVGAMVVDFLAAGFFTPPSSFLVLTDNSGGGGTGGAVARARASGARTTGYLLHPPHPPFLLKAQRDQAADQNRLPTK